VPVLKHPYEKGEVAYEEKSRRMVVQPYHALSTTPDRITAGVLRGSMAGGRIPWVQFRVFCGDTAAPFLVTPRITVNNLKRQGSGYFYVVR